MGNNKAQQIRAVEQKLRGLAVGNLDVYYELLRERNRLLGGDPNKLNHQLDAEYREAGKNGQTN